MNTFAELLADLSRNGVKYILVGGLAVDLCGYSRMTLDVDIIVDYSKSNLELLLNRLLHFGQGSAQELSYQDFDLEEGCIRIVEDFPLDLFTVMRGYTYPDLIQYVKYQELEEVAIPYLSAEGLIKLKQNSLRPKDQLDVQMLATLLAEHHQITQKHQTIFRIWVIIKNWLRF
jgi:hypothetical protein